MKIGIDASRAFLDERTGTEEYSHELLRHLAKINCNHQFFLYLRKGAKIDFELPSNFFPREIEGDFLWTQFHLSLELLHHKVDALFVPSHTVPLFHPKRTVVTVHGLEYKHCPECYPARDRILTDMNTFLSLSFAKRIIAPSENTKRDIENFYSIDPRGIRVIRHGINMPVGGAQEKDTGELDILFIGRLEKRKNVTGIVRAFDLFMKKVDEAAGGSGANIRLILAGKKGFGYGEIEDAIARSPHKGNILLPGYVTAAQKRELYSQADVFIFPSFYEGFGMPVWEAMSYGVPVICSANSSTEEIAGGAAMLVDPRDTEKICEALTTLCCNEEERKRLIAKGFEILENAGWEKCAKETMAVLTEWE